MGVRGKGADMVDVIADVPFAWVRSEDILSFIYVETRVLEVVRGTLPRIP